VVLTSVVSTAQRRTKTMVFFLVSKSKTVSSWWVGLMGLASRLRSGKHFSFFSCYVSFSLSLFYFRILI
jgi:hypothetical protein